MKKYIILTLCFAFTELGFAQNTHGLVTYKLARLNKASYNPDMTDGKTPVTVKFTDSMWLYQTHRRMTSLPSEINQPITKKDGNVEAIFMAKGDSLKYPYLNELFVNRQTRKYIARESDGLYVDLVQDTLEIMKWNLFNETKIIQKFNCQKATAVFGGRIWEAWFTTEIPVPIGPWKLHGLPGLILEATDNFNDFKFEFGGIQLPYYFKCDGICSKFEADKAISHSEFKRLRLRRKERLESSVKASISTEGVTTSSYVAAKYWLEKD